MSSHPQSISPTVTVILPGPFHTEQTEFYKRRNIIKLCLLDHMNAKLVIIIFTYNLSNIMTFYLRSP